jgi:hypothetical protein
MRFLGRQIRASAPVIDREAHVIGFVPLKPSPGGMDFETHWSRSAYEAIKTTGPLGGSTLSKKGKQAIYEQRCC